jgi:hypothetical protein
MTNAERCEGPNLFDLEGDGVSVTYSTSSIAGVPQFGYRDRQRTVNRSGEEIRTLGTEIGCLVTIDIEQVPDLHTLTFTLLLPRINLPEGSTATALQTVGVLTTDRTSIGGPDLVVGQVQTYRGVYLRGTARRVAF